MNEQDFQELMSHAFKEFVDKIQLFDPLDRKIYSDDEEDVNQATSSSDIKKIINDMSYLTSDQLNFPMTEELVQKLK